MRLFGLLAAAVLIAACETQTTPASSTTVPPTTTTAAPADGAAAVALFGNCMLEADHPIAEIPLDEVGRPDLGTLTENATTDPAFREALTACAPLLGGFLSVGESPGYSALVREELVRYAQCMRASGVEAFPDPLPDFGGTSVPFPPDLVPTSDPEFSEAVEACASGLTVTPAP